MRHGKGPFSFLVVLLSGVLGACNLWGTNMKATEFFESKEFKLLEAIQKGDENRAREILESENLTLNTRGKDDITPLFWLMMQKDHEVVERALTLGSDPNLMAGNGHNPVTFMAGGNDPDMLRLLLEHGGDPNSKDADGEPALFSAIGQEQWENIKILLEYGADPNLTDGPNRNSAHYAAMLNKFEIVHFLLERGADHTNRNDAGGDIAWIIHESLTENLINPEFKSYEWALKVKKQLKNRGVEFPPPSPEEVREQWKQEGKL